MDVFFQWLFDTVEKLYIMYVIRPYERGVHIRLGSVLRTVGPGWYFQCPFGVDDLHKVNIVTTTHNLPTQVVTASNGTLVALGIVVVWRVREEAVERIVVDLEDYDDVLNDTTTGMVPKTVAEFDWPLDLSSLQDAVLTAVRRRMGRYGIDVQDIYITDFGKARIFRLVQSD